MENLSNHVKIRKLTQIALLVSLSLILSYFDILISRVAFPFLPTTKIGFANVIVVYAIYQLDFKEAFLIAMLKSLMSLLLGNVIGFVISLCASFLSFFGMYGGYLVLKKIASPISISVIGGFLHIVGQLLVVQLIYRLGNVLMFYSAIVVFVSLITSILIGFIALQLLAYMKKQKNS
ncbi:MAG: Gx transporter family protein [Bacilli bacterium]|nr:Gx transporter family protein [Bacilli bacterium]